MSYTKGIIFAFSPFGKAAKASVFAVGGKIIPASGEYFMTISLVAYVPYQLIVRSIEYIVQRYGQFNDTQASSEMASMDADYVNDVLP
jgi:hypothetical protein